MPDIGETTGQPGLQLLPCNPVRIPRVFDDPDAVMARFRDLAPVPSIAAFLGIGNSSSLSAWFRCDLSEDLFFNNPVFMDAARKAFSASIVRPTRCRLNIYGPMPAATAPHLDAAAYRGMSVENAPIWLIYNMSASRLFEPWLAPVASGLAWFYQGKDGEFEYWPDGEYRVERSPMWNSGLVCDNEYTWHRVGAVGSPEAQRRLAGRLNSSDMMYATGDREWEIRDGERVVERLDANEVRISVLWKADIFRDEDHLASFSDRSLDLDIGKVTEIYLEDLDAKGVSPKRPGDPLTDSAWRQLLEEAYPTPFSSS